jgi:hypothetical protein
MRRRFIYYRVADAVVTVVASLTEEHRVLLCVVQW